MFILHRIHNNNHKIMVGFSINNLGFWKKSGIMAFPSVENMTVAKLKLFSTFHTSDKTSPRRYKTFFWILLRF